jgi:hypothetical protein
MQAANEEMTPVSVPRIKEVGPSFKTADEHFHVFKLDDGRYAFVIGNVSWGRRDFLPIDLPEGVELDFCDDLSSAEEEWENWAETLEDNGDPESADNMRDVWNVAWVRRV